MAAGGATGEGTPYLDNERQAQLVAGRTDPDKVSIFIHADWDTILRAGVKMGEW